MCETCGCSDNTKPKLINLQSGLTLAIGTANDRDIDEHARARAPRSHASSTITTTSHHHRPRPQSWRVWHGHSHSHDHSHSHQRHDRSARNGRARQEQPPGGAQPRLVCWPQYPRLEPDERPGAGKTTLLERTIHDLRTS